MFPAAAGHGRGIDRTDSEYFLFFLTRLADEKIAATYQCIFFALISDRSTKAPGIRRLLVSPASQNSVVGIRCCLGSARGLTSIRFSEEMAHGERLQESVGGHAAALTLLGEAKLPGDRNP